QLNISPQEQLEEQQPFSAPFHLTNTGYLGLHIDRIYCGVNHLEDTHSNTTDNVWTNRDEWNHFDLDRGETKTVLCHMSIPASDIKEADIEFRVDYTFLWMKWHRDFRFVGIGV